MIIIRSCEKISEDLETKNKRNREPGNIYAEYVWSVCVWLTRPVSTMLGDELNQVL